MDSVGKTIMINPIELQNRYRRSRLNTRQTENVLRSDLRKIRELGDKISSEEVRNFIHRLDVSLQDLDAVRIEVLADYVTELILLLNNFAIDAPDFGKFFNATIRFFEKQQISVTELYLAQAQYLGKTGHVESKERQEVLRTAVQRATDPEDKLKSLLALASYHTDISEYYRSIELFESCQEIINQNSALKHYEIRVLVGLGVNHFTSFNDHALAEKYLQDACRLTEQYPQNAYVIRVTSTAYHYLGRIAEVKEEYQQAVDLYVLGQQYLEKGFSELGATAFYHLRLGELLVTARNFIHAQEHLELSRKMFEKTGNRSSGIIQAELAIAALYSAQGQDEDAKVIIEQVIHNSRNYVRGELLGLGYLLTLQFKRLELLRAGGTLLRIARTLLLGGELKRNNVLKLITKLPILVRLLLQRIKSSPSRVEKETEATAFVLCTCPMHQP